MQRLKATLSTQRKIAGAVHLMPRYRNKPAQLIDLWRVGRAG
jgi:hypothetical protein